MPPKRVASEAAKATQGRACFEGRCGSAFLASCGRASPVLEQMQAGKPALIKKDGGEMLIAIMLDRTCGGQSIGGSS